MNKFKKKISIISAAIMVAFFMPFFNIETNAYSIDISSYQGNNNFAEAKGSLDHVILKATQGEFWNDSSFYANYQGCIENNIPVGAYHYADTHGTPESQANHFADRLINKHWDLKPVLDLEQSVGMNKSDFVRRFATVIQERTGMPIVLYSGAYFARDNFDSDVKANYPLWYASYPSEWSASRLGYNTIAGHQYGGDDWGISINGIGSNLDCNVIYEPFMLRGTSNTIPVTRHTQLPSKGAYGKVAELQRFLGVIDDNIYGPETDNALRNSHFNANVSVFYHNAELTRWIQLRLGCNADGIFGSKTAAAVKNWQSSHGLTVDGIAGYNTIKSLALA